MYQDSTSAHTAAGEANLINKFFHSVFSTNTDPMTLDNSFSDGSLCSINISLHDTFTALTSLYCSKAMGGDGIPPIILKCTAVALLEPIHHLFVLCLPKSYLPKEWRSHRITPIFKSGDRSVVLTTVLSSSSVVSLKACPHLIRIRSTSISHLDPPRMDLDQSTSFVSALRT